MALHHASRDLQRARPAGEWRGLATDGSPAVEAHDLRKCYDGLVAVEGIDFSVSAGECFGFLGPNGAGKTSTMKMIYGLATIDGGRLHVLGSDVAKSRRAVKYRIGVVPQEENLDRSFAVREGMMVHGAYYGLDRQTAAARTDELLRFVSLHDRAQDTVLALSGGMKRRLLIARALINEPDLVVLDEPTTGLDPQARHAVWTALERLKRRGTTLLLTTHYMEEATRLCDRLVIMDHGRIITEGTPADLIAAHVGREVLELSVGENFPVDELVATLAGSFAWHELTDHQVLLYGDDADAMRDAIDHERFQIERTLSRRATLEDVFLRLTGRMLRE